MGRIRVHELAKRLGLTSKDAIAKLVKLGFSVTSHASAVDEDQVRALERAVQESPPEQRIPPEAGPPGQPKPAEVPQPRRAEPTAPEVGDVVEIPDPVSVRELAGSLHLDVSDILRELLTRGHPANINSHVSSSAARAIAADLGIAVRIVGERVAAPEGPRDGKPVARRVKARVALPPEVTVIRVPPVVTVMGHVDHGKTTLLDAIRQTHVTAQEYGGITQHIGASIASHQGREIVFIDTPGHEAFTAMRARGAQVTDLAVLVVAADDGIMPQTIEAIDHARSAGVPIVVAINKIDLPRANPDRVLQQLADRGLVPEAWGGDTVCVSVSALSATNLDGLLEMILLVADIQELQAPVGVPGKAVVIEAKRDSSRGPVATVIVKEGHVRVGDPVVCGSTCGKVRAMTAWDGHRVEEACPGTPVEIAGLNDVPAASDELRVLAEVKKAREIARQSATASRQAGLATAPLISLEALFQQVQAGAVKELRLILKADAHGTVEALAQALSQLRHEEIEIKVLHQGVGSVGESDVMLAAASQAIVIGFQVGLEPGVNRLAISEKVDVRIYQVIYDVIDDVKAAMVGMLEPIYQEVPLGRAEVRALFKISRVGTIAGCYVLEGIIRRGEKIRVRRNGEVIWEGPLSSLKHVKEDIRETSAGRECGIAVAGWNGFTEGDIIEAYTHEKVERRWQ